MSCKVYKTTKCYVKIFSSSSIKGSRSNYKQMANKLKNFFLNDLNYKCENIVFDFTKDKLENELKNLAKSEVLAECDGLIVIISSCFNGSRLRYHDYDEVTIHFSNENCEYLIGKPKLFIINTNDCILNLFEFNLIYIIISSH